jgi:hypothetical protein
MPATAATSAAAGADKHVFVLNPHRNPRRKIQNLLLRIPIQDLRQVQKRRTPADLAAPVPVALRHFLAIFTQVRLLNFHFRFPLAPLGVPCATFLPRPARASPANQTHCLQQAISQEVIVAPWTAQYSKPPRSRPACA